MVNQLKFAMCFIALVGLLGCGDPSGYTTTIGSHSVTIIDSSGKPYGGTSRTHRDDVAGVTTHAFESANGRYEITLEGDVMSINGEKYTLEKPGASIRIVDDQVEINGIVAEPDAE